MLFISAFTQETEFTVEQEYVPDSLIDQHIFTIVEQQAEFPGGYSKMADFIFNHIKYPKQAFDESIEGTVYVQFVVRKTGKVTDYKVLRGIGYGCDQEALRVIKKMPKWIPAQQKGQQVSMYFNLPINFKLTQRKTQ